MLECVSLYSMIIIFFFGGGPKGVYVLRFLTSKKQSYWVFVTISDFLIPTSLQPDSVNFK